jgi:hypothetical protein
VRTGAVLTVADIGTRPLAELLRQYRLELRLVGDGLDIPGSYWGDAEAGILGSAVYARRDTPVHSVLHETCHIICMDAQRRASLDTDAGGDDQEEAAVCCLQILLADQLDGVGRDRLMADMDAWGYSFRLGSTRAWFDADAEDALAWLVGRGLVAPSSEPTGQLRTG